MASKVLALKYRPKNFSELVGQTSVAKTLKLALNGQRLSHAYLFSGLRGSGKTSTARIFAKALLCEEGINETPCETCNSCQSANNGSNIDIIEMDGASNRKIDDIRGIIEQTKYRPSSGRFKIFIIDEVHMLTKEAFNALLKTLEEPPDYIKFILATTDPLNLPTTVLSRVQHFHFKRIDFDSILKHLEFIMQQENVNYDIEALKIIIRNGNGSLRDTLTLLEQAIVFSPEKLTQENVISMLGLIDPDHFHNLFQAIFEKKNENILQYTKLFSDYEPELVLDEIIHYLKEQLFSNSDIRFNSFVVQKFFEILNESKQIIAISNDNEFILGLTFLKMSEYSRLSEIEQLLHFLEKNPTVSIKHLENIDLDSIHRTQKSQNKTSEEKQVTPHHVDDNSVHLTQMRKFESLVEFISENKNKNITVANVKECFFKRVNIDFIDTNPLETILIFETCFQNDEECKKIIRARFNELKNTLILSFSKDGNVPKVRHRHCQADSKLKQQNTINREQEQKQEIAQIQEPEITIQPQPEYIPEPEIPAEIVRETFENRNSNVPEQQQTNINKANLKQQILEENIVKNLINMFHLESEKDIKISSKE